MRFIAHIVCSTVYRYLIHLQVCKFFPSVKGAGWRFFPSIALRVHVASGRFSFWLSWVFELTKSQPRWTFNSLLAVISESPSFLSGGQIVGFKQALTVGGNQGHFNIAWGFHNLLNGDVLTPPPHRWPDLTKDKLLIIQTACLSHALNWCMTLPFTKMLWQRHVKLVPD